jgi:hypothetical protein
MDEGMEDPNIRGNEIINEILPNPPTMHGSNPPIKIKMTKYSRDQIFNDGEDDDDDDG